MKYLILNRIKVQNANAVAGLTWGFPAITHFLGFTHNISRKLSSHHLLSKIKLEGCSVVSHDQITHTFGKYDKSFTQYRSQPYRHGENKKDSSPPIIEEGKMNMTISIIIKIDGNIGNMDERFLEFIQNCCFSQKLAGGTILSIECIELLSEIKDIKKKLLPGFVLMDRSDYLEAYHQEKLREDSDIKDCHLKVWLDFSALKQSARPSYSLISKEISKNLKEYKEEWEGHLEKKPYTINSIPNQVKEYFLKLKKDKKNKKLLEEWESYLNPTSKTNAEWEYVTKPESGFLVPIMSGYKAISPVYKNNEIENTRDHETDVCFAESIYSIGEWLSPHRVKDLDDTLWYYRYEENHYLCTQVKNELLESEEEADY